MNAMEMQGNKTGEIERNLIAGVQGMTEQEDEDLRRIVQDVSDGRTNATNIGPLSPLQEGMLFHCLLNPHSDTYVFSTLFEFDSRVHLQKWIRAVSRVI